jgi:TetR/AcrR family transcriptional repressor of nem operon
LETLHRQGFNASAVQDITELADQSRPIRDRLASTFVAWSRPIEACIRDGQKAGEILRESDPRVLAEFLLNSFEGAMLRVKVEKDSSPLDQFMTVIVSRALT